MLNALDYNTLISYIKERDIKLKNLKAKKDTEYYPKITYPPLTYKYQKGLYESNVKFNFHGNYLTTLLRRSFKVPDDNGFATFFVLESYLQTHTLVTDSMSFDQEYHLDTMNALLAHRCQSVSNPLRNDLPVYSFWNQSKNDQGVYVQYPDNLENPLSIAFDFNETIKKVLTMVGLEYLYDKIYNLISRQTNFLYIFQITSDSDDTGMNMVVGSQLQYIKKKYGDKLPVDELADFWVDNHSNFEDMFDLAVKYSYCPASADKNKNLIDARTYFWLRNHIYEHPDACYTTTWFTNLDDDNYSSPLGIRMPFHVNNIDATVATNFMFGSSMYLLYVNPDYMNEDLFKMFNSNLNMLSYIFEEDWLSKRNDLVILYYPPTYDFYWFVARYYNLIRNNKDSQAKMISSGLLTQGLERLEAALKTYATTQLLNLVKTSSDGKYSYFDDILGNGDTLFGSPHEYHEDRVFSSATGLNALIDIWTQGEKLEYLSDTPEQVKSVIDRIVLFLLEEGDKYEKENVFFSGSVKSGKDLSYSFPANYIYDMDGTELSCSSHLSFATVVGVSGIVTDVEYKKLVDQKECFGIPYPIYEYDGLNCKTCMFPFWSSPAVTEAFSMLAVAKYANLTA